jgi:hypothetical protein
VSSFFCRRRIGSNSAGQAIFDVRVVTDALERHGSVLGLRGAVLRRERGVGRTHSRHDRDARHRPVRKCVVQPAADGCADRP